MSDTSPISSLVSSFFGPIIQLRDEIRKYKRKKEINNFFLNALEDETKTYIDAFEEMSKYGNEQVKPALLAIKTIPTRNQMNNLMAVVSKVPTFYIKLIAAFIDIPKACSEVSKLEGFMGHSRKITLHNLIL